MDIRSMNLEEMEALAISLGEKAFRGKQLFQWVHEKQADDFDEMTNLSAAFREKLKENYCISGVRQVEKQVSKKEDTAKYLFALEDDHVIESVWMKYRHGNSVCISSQVGCRMGCTFCASTLTGLTRNLTAGEMLSQIYQIQKDTKERVSNIIVMGMGEPLDNYEELLRFIKLVSCEKGIGISQRNITVSSCGLVPKIYDLADEGFAITFALSLHASTDEKRRELMPIANTYSIAEVLQACRYYFDKTWRRVTFEYSLVAGENDSKEDAKRLADLLKGMSCHVNLIPVNPIKERSFKRADENSIQKFKQMLEKNTINVTIRRGMGKDIDAACGQLRKTYIESE